LPTSVTWYQETLFYKKQWHIDLYETKKEVRDYFILNLKIRVYNDPLHFHGAFSLYYIYRHKKEPEENKQNQKLGDFR